MFVSSPSEPSASVDFGTGSVYIIMRRGPVKGLYFKHQKFLFCLKVMNSSLNILPRLPLGKHITKGFVLFSATWRLLDPPPVRLFVACLGIAFCLFSDGFCHPRTRFSAPKLQRCSKRCSKTCSTHGPPQKGERFPTGSESTAEVRGSICAGAVVQGWLSKTASTQRFSDAVVN